MSKSNKLLIIGAGLPRTGTNSTQLALEILLDGPCYHMKRVMDGKEERDFWARALEGCVTREEWKEMLEGRGYRAGVDYPIAIFYK